MRKSITVLLALCLALAMTAAAEEPATPTDAAALFTMSGYDDANTGHDWNNNLFFVRMEEKTGVRFIYDQHTQMEEYTLFVDGLKPDGAELPDVLFKACLTPAQAQKLYQDGVLIDLRPYLETEAPALWALLQEHPDWEKALTLPDGAIVTLPMIDPLMSNNAIWINQKWLRMVGMEMPASADELTEVLRAFKTKDPNRNGRADEIPLTFTGWWDLRFLGHAYGIISNDYHVQMDADGTVRETMTSDDMRSFLAWLHLLWEEELIDRAGFTTADTVRQVTDNNATVTYGVVFGTTPLALLPGSAVTDYVLMTPLEHNGRRVYRSFLGEMTRGTFAVTSHCANPAALVRWVDYLYTLEGCYLARSGAEDEEYLVNEDGTWYWEADADSLSGVLADSIISDGSATPGYVDPQYQLNFEDAQTHRLIAELVELAGYARLPYPLVYLSADESARVNTLWTAISADCEPRMVWFVTGDVPLTDETWAAYCARVKELGMDELVGIWQTAADR